MSSCLTVQGDSAQHTGHMMLFPGSRDCRIMFVCRGKFLWKLKPRCKSTVSIQIRWVLQHQKKGSSDCHSGSVGILAGVYNNLDQPVRNNVREYRQFMKDSCEKIRLPARLICCMFVFCKWKNSQRRTKRWRSLCKYYVIIINHWQNEFKHFVRLKWNLETSCG